MNKFVLFVSVFALLGLTACGDFVRDGTLPQNEVPQEQEILEIDADDPTITFLGGELTGTYQGTPYTAELTEITLTKLDENYGHMRFDLVADFEPNEYDSGAAMARFYLVDGFRSSIFTGSDMTVVQDGELSTGEYAMFPLYCTGLNPYSWSFDEEPNTVVVLPEPVDEHTTRTHFTMQFDRNSDWNMSGHFDFVQ